MRIVRLATCALLLLAFGSSGVLASGFENTGLGTTARGLGGAFRAIANDWSAAYYNPAGYAFIADNQVGANISFIHFRNEITPDFQARDRFGNKYGWGVVNNQPIYNFHEILNKPATGLLARLPIFGETVVGFSIYQPFDANTTWRVYSPQAAGLSAFNDSAAAFIPSDHFKNDLDVVAFQFSAGREFMENKLALGIGLQILRADLGFSDLALRPNPRLAPVNDRPRDRIPEFTTNTGDGWGFGVRGGMLWKKNEKLNIAVTAYYPFDITISGRTEFTFVMPWNDALAKQVGLSLEDQLFVKGGSVELTSDFEAKLQLPPSMGIGLAYQVTEALTVSLDAEYTFWSVYDGLQFTYTGFSGLPYYINPSTGERIEKEGSFFTANLSNNVEWDNSGKVMLGAMYHYGDLLTLLGGLSADQSPSRSSSTSVTPQFIDTGDKYGFNGGIILHIDRWDLGVITSYIKYPELNIAGLSDTDGDNIFDNFPGDYNASTYETVLSFGYWF